MVKKYKYTPRKKKGTAILLTLLFGMFGWIYTYKADAWKFWLNLALTLITMGFWGIVAGIWAFIDALVKPREFYDEYYKHFK